MVSEIVDMYRIHGIETLVMAASIRHPLHCSEAARVGADIATIPYAVICKMANHPLTDQGLSIFLNDWFKSN